MPVRPNYSIILTGVMVLLVSACVQGPANKSTPAATTTTATTSGSQNLAQATKPPVIPAQKPPTAAALFDLKADDLMPLFGQPALKRDDGRAQIWRYQGDACQLYLFLYQPKSGGNFSMRHLEAVRLSNRDKTSEPASAAETQTCIDEIWRQNKQPVTS